MCVSVNVCMYSYLLIRRALTYGNALVGLTNFSAKPS